MNEDSLAHMKACVYQEFIVTAALREEEGGILHID